MSDETTLALIAALLAATPTDSAGEVYTGDDEYDMPIFDDPAPIAVGQLVAVLRWLADNAPVHDYGEFIGREWSDAELDALADEIERSGA